MDIYNSIQLNRESNKHLYIQLFEAIKDMIINKKIGPNEKLPPIRKLSKLLKVNNVTIVKAYQMLEENNYIYKRVGSGTFVSDINGFERNYEYNKEKDIYKDLKLMDSGQIQITDQMINFASATPTADLFPVKDFKNVLVELLDRDGGHAFGYQDSKGYYPLREAIVDYLKPYHINTSMEKIQIISGAQQGIDIIAKALLNHGDTVIVESPTYTGAIATFKSRGVNIVGVPILKDGIDFNILDENIKRYSPKLIYTMPNFQNPTGYSYDTEAKKRLINLAYKNDIIIIEDDYLSDLNFDTKENVTLKSIDENENVIYIKSFSKIFMPGLRLGFLIVPLSVNNDILIAKHTTDISTSGLIQRAFDLYLKKGIWKDHITYMKEIYSERFKIMIDCLERHFPNEVLFNKPQGGISFWVELPKGVSINELYSEAIKNNIVFIPGNIFYPSNTDSNYIRLSIAAVYKDSIEKGIITLGKLINKQMMKDGLKNSNNYYRPIL